MSMESRFHATIALVTKALSGDYDAYRRLRRSGSFAPEDLQPLVDATICAVQERQELLASLESVEKMNFKG